MENPGSAFSRRRFVKGLAVIGGGLAVFGLDACSNPATNPTTTTTEAVMNNIKVGIMAPYTGAAASKGKPMGDGVQDAVKYINDELSGVQGHKIEVIFEDDQYDSSLMTTQINDIIQKGAVMFTTQASAEMTPVMGIANDAGLPGFTVFSAPHITQPPKHIYASFPDYGDDWAAFATYYLASIWKGSGRPKMALMLLNNPTGSGASDAADLKAAAMGIDLIKPYDVHTSTSQNTGGELDYLVSLRSQNPDVIYISSTPDPSAAIIKNIKAQQTAGYFQNTAIGCGGASFTSVMVTEAGTAAEGVWGVYPTVNWGDNVSAMAKMTEYINKLHPEDAGNADYITGWGEGLIIAEILRLAIVNTPAGGNALTPQLVEANGFKKLSNFDVGGLQGPATYTAGDNRFSKTVKLYQVKNGAITAVGSWVNAPFINYGYT